MSEPEPEEEAEVTWKNGIPCKPGVTIVRPTGGGADRG